MWLHIEGLAGEGDHPLQKAWKQCNVPQCGYCQSGQIMQAASMLKTNTEADGRRNRDRDAGQHLPLRNVSAHPVRRLSSRRG